MLVERTDFEIRPGAEDAFAADMTSRGRALFAGVPGASDFRLGRGVEHPSRFTMLLTWTSLDAHHAYHGTEACAEIRRIIGAHAVGATMQHFEFD